MNRHYLPLILALVVFAVTLLAGVSCVASRPPSSPGGVSPLFSLTSLPTGQVSEREAAVDLALASPVALNTPVSVAITIRPAFDLEQGKITLLYFRPDVGVTEQSWDIGDVPAGQEARVVGTVYFLYTGIHDVSGHIEDRLGGSWGTSFIIDVQDEGYTLNPTALPPEPILIPTNKVIIGVDTPDPAVTPPPAFTVVPMPAGEGGPTLQPTPEATSAPLEQSTTSSEVVPLEPLIASSNCLLACTPGQAINISGKLE